MRTRIKYQQRQTEKEGRAVQEGGLGGEEGKDGQTGREEVFELNGAKNANYGRLNSESDKPVVPSVKENIHCDDLKTR